MKQEDREAIAAKRICCDCVRENFLTDAITQSGKVGLCDYCEDDEAPTWSIVDLADRVESAFDDHLFRTPTEPDADDYYLYADPDFGRTWYREGQETTEAIEDAAKIPRAASADIQALLDDRHGDMRASRWGKETEFSSEAHYDWKGTDDAGWHREWQSSFKHLFDECRVHRHSTGPGDLKA